MDTENVTTESEIRREREGVIDAGVLDRLMAQVASEGLELLGPDGVLTELTSRIMNRALEIEMTDHLGYEKGDPGGWGSGNNRNGTTPKTVLTDTRIRSFITGTGRSIRMLLARLTTSYRLSKKLRIPVRTGCGVTFW